MTGSNSPIQIITEETRKFEATVRQAIREYQANTGLRVIDIDINWLDVTDQQENIKGERPRYVMGVVRADVAF
jgi:hypothetical protein